MPVKSTLGALVEFKVGTQPIYSIPSAPYNVTVSRPASTDPVLLQNYKLIKIDWNRPNSTGGFVTGYSVKNNLGTEVANVAGTANTTTITIPIANIETNFTYVVSAFNPAGSSANSNASASIKSAPSANTNLGSQIGYYVGNGLVILGDPTTGSWTTANNWINNNVSNTAYTSTYFFPNISTLQTYRTVSGGYLTNGGPFWSSSLCGNGNANFHQSMSNAGTATCSANTNAYTVFPFGNLV